MPGLDRGLPAAQGSSLAIEGVDEPYYMARDALIINDFTGERERIGGNVSLQFAPNDRSEYSLEAFYNGYRNESFNNMLFSFVDWHVGLGGLVKHRDAVEWLDGTLSLNPGCNEIRQ